MTTDTEGAERNGESNYRGHVGQGRLVEGMNEMGFERQIGVWGIQGVGRISMHQGTAVEHGKGVSMNCRSLGASQGEAGRSQGRAAVP